VAGRQARPIVIAARTSTRTANAATESGAANAGTARTKGTFGKVDEVASNDQSSFLPESADATRVAERLPDFLGDEAIPAVLVVTGDGELTDDQLAEVQTLVDEIAGISAGGMPVRVKCLHALAGQFRGAGQARRPGPDHGRPLRPGDGLLIGLEAQAPTVLDQEALDLADLDGPADAGGAALLLAQPWGGAEHAAGPAQGVVLLYRADRPGDIAQPQLADERARVGLRRAAPGARCVVTQQAAVRLGQGLGEVESLAHLLELIRVAHGRAS